MEEAIAPARRISIGRDEGFTLVEVVVAIAILAIALVTVANMLSLGLSRSADTYDQTRTTALAQAYLDEILSRRYDERSHPSGTPPCTGLAGDDPAPDRPCTLEAGFGTDGGESSRDRYDDVDDYHGIDEGSGGASGPNLLDAEGLVRGGYDNFRVQVDVSYAGDQAPLGGALTDAKLVTVTVIHPGQPDGVKFSVYKANY